MIHNSYVRGVTDSSTMERRYEVHNKSGVCKSEIPVSRIAATSVGKVQSGHLAYNLQSTQHELYIGTSSIPKVVTIVEAILTTL